MKAAGEFQVNGQPLETSLVSSDGNIFSRTSLAKTFHGDLAGQSQVEMLGVNTAVQDSAGYVALEQVSGTLHGKSGSFVLQHYGMMKRGELRLTLEVVPDSGSGQLAGLSGQMTIQVEQGKHFY